MSDPTFENEKFLKEIEMKFNLQFEEEFSEKTAY
jgi:hypothetical protein